MRIVYLCNHAMLLSVVECNGLGCVSSDVTTSVAVSAEIPLRSPQKIFIFIIKKIICWVKESKNNLI